MRFRLLMMGIAALLLAACGTVAETQPTFEPTNTGQPRLVSDDEDENVAVAEHDATAEVAEVATEAPTATLEPTAEPSLAPTATPEPTAEVVATEEAAEDTGTTTVVIDGTEYVGDATYGRDTFEFVANVDTGQMCITCHNPDEPVHGVGPYLYGIATVADERIEGMSAVEYLYQSIVDPNAHLAPPQIGPDGQEVPWPPNLMPQNWHEQLDAQQIADLVAFLMTLNQERPE